MPKLFKHEPAPVASGSPNPNHPPAKTAPAPDRHLAKKNRDLLDQLAELSERLDYLTESEERYRALAEELEDGIAIVVGGIITWVNPAVERLSGYRAAEMIGRTVERYFPAEELPALRRRMRDLLRGRTASNALVSVGVRKNGQHFFLEMQLKHVRLKRTRVLIGILRDITARFEAEESLRESELKFRTLATEIREGVAVHVDGRIVWANEACLLITGYAPADLIGRSIEQFFLPEERIAARRRLMERLEGKPMPERYEATLIRRDRQRIITDIVSQRITFEGKNAVLVVARDITQRRAAEDALRESEHKFRSLFDGVPVGLYRFAPDGRILDANLAMVDLLGYPGREALLGRKAEDLFAGASCLDEILTENGVRERELTVVRHDGSRIWVRDSARAVRDESSGLLYCEGALESIEERKQAEAALQESERRLQAIVEGSPIPQFVIDRRHRVLHWNQALEEICGIPAARLVGTDRHWAAFYASARPCLVDLVVDNRVEEIPQWYYGRLNPSHSVAGAFEELSFFPQFGETGKWLHFTACTIRDSSGQVVGGVETLEDVTERVRAEEALRQSEAKYREMVETAQEGVCMLDAEARVRYVNRRITDMLGFSAEEVTGRPLFDLVDAEVQTLAREHFADTRQGALGQYDLAFRHANGRAVWTIVSINPVFDAQGNFSGALVMLTDISARRQAETEKWILQEKMQQAQKLESLGVLAGGIAHDFNNLLMGILGHASLARQAVLPGSAMQNSLEQIETAAQRAAELTNQLLAYSGKGKFVTAAVNLSQLVQEMAHLLKVSISKKAELVCQLAEALPAVEGEPAQLRQVIMNLITNASDAIGDAEGTITVRTGALELTAEDLARSYFNDALPGGRYVFAEVADTGCGMDGPTLAKIFDPFFTTKFTGRGLGLAAVVGIVRGHKGALWVESRAGAGTRFRIALPASAQRAPALPEAKDLTGFKGHGTVLVVDDEEGVRVIVEMILADYGYRVLTAADGRQALDIFRQHPGEVDAVILDLTMPHLSGVETFRELRKIDPKVQVILSSGYSEDESVSQFTGEGLAGFIQKPYNVSALIQKLRETLKQ